MNLKTQEALKCLVRKTAAGETDSPEEVLDRARTRKPSFWAHTFLPRLQAEEMGEAVGLAEAGGVDTIRATDRYPALRALFHIAGGAAIGASIGATNPDRRNAGLSALLGAGVGALAGRISQAATSKIRARTLAQEGLARLEKASPSDVRDNVLKALNIEPSYLGGLVRMGPLHRGRLRALAAASGQDADTRLNLGVSTAEGFSPLLSGVHPMGAAAATIGSAGLGIYDAAQAHEAHNALYSKMSKGPRGRA